MDTKNGEFIKRLQATFRLEADEHVRALSTGLIEFEKTTDTEKRKNVIETVFREAHSLKGAARSVNLPEIESVCQALEGAFASLKRRDIPPEPGVLDLFHQTIDHIARLTSSGDTKQTGKDTKRTGDLIRELDKVSKGMPVSGKRERPAPSPIAENQQMQVDTVRIPITRLDPLLLQAEEMISAKMASHQRMVELREINNALVIWKSELDKWKDRGAGSWELGTRNSEQGEEGSGQSTELNEFLAWNDERLNELQGRIAAVSRASEQDQRALRRMVDNHLEATKELLMLPVGTLVEVLPKLVRDLAGAQGKEVELTIQGAGIEIDKRILGELKDPLIHLVRNCVDHGIKKPEERTRVGKPPGGTIRLNFAAKNNRQMEVSVSDDGSGIEREKVRTAAVKLGLLQADAAEKLDGREATQLIFLSGISTSPIITDISGRGLGLAIVREKVEKLGGTVTVESEKDIGTTFRLLVPMTLATFRGVLVRAGEHLFMLPAFNVERVLRTPQEHIKTVENRETIKLDGKILSMARLCDTMELPVRKNGAVSARTPGTVEASVVFVVFLKFMDERMAFLVDEVLQEQEVLVKGLGAQLKRVRNIAGATILGTGRVVPVLNVQDLMKSALRSATVVRQDAVAGTTTVSTGSILVAEDSITSRSLLKNILETAGYRVTTAVDGADAFTRLRSGEFDLVVSDVDMPRMNGFELTVKIRADKKLGDLPVVLVTALESRQDKERGIEAGANAYIVKSSFDQSNLLEVIRRFL